MHNLSQLYPGLKLICQGEKPTKKIHYASHAFIQPEDLIEMRKQPALSSKLLAQKAKERTQATQSYKSKLE